MKTRKSDTRKLVSFFYEVGTLRKIPRSHMQALLTSDLSDNIASHSFRAAIIGWFLAKKARLDSSSKRAKADPFRVAIICLFHDVAESRSNDHNWVHKKYVKIFEEEITKDQMSEIDEEGEVAGLLKEYEERKSLESILAKDADRLEQILLEREYAHTGNLEAKKWYQGRSQFSRLKTKWAIELAKEIYAQKAGDWWWNDWTSERRK